MSRVAGTHKEEAMTQALTPETLVYELRAAGDPQIAPDGRRNVYVLNEIDKESKQPRSQLWMCAIDGSDARQLTQTGERNGGPRWSPDGTRIAFVSDRVAASASKGKEKDKDQNRKVGIFVLPADGVGEARELTSHGQGISDLAWSPDGARLAYSTTFDPENPDEKAPQEGEAPEVRVTRRIDYKQDNRGYLGDTRVQVFVVDVASGERRRVTTEPVDHNFPQWSPDGSRIATQVPNRNGLCSQLALVDVASGETTLVGPEDGNVGVWSWSPGGDRIIFGGDTRQTWQEDFFVYTVANGDVRRLTDDLPSLPVGGVPGMAPASQPVWLDERQVLFHSVRAGASRLEIIDAEGGAVELVAHWQSQNAGLATDSARRYVAQGRSTLEEVGEIVVYDKQRDELKVITGVNADVLRGHPPAGWERFDVRRGEFTIEAWLLKPPDFDPDKRYPLLLGVHGGPNGFYGYAFNPLHQALAAAGFLVAFSNPRGSSSYGRHFTLQVARDWGGEDFKDLMAVVDAVLARPYADRARTGIFGYSYGGYMTAWTIGQTDRFKAAVCGAPCFDLESMYGTSDISHTFGELQWGGPPHEDREWYAAHSPSTYAHRAKTPTLIVHGEADERCPIGQGEQMFVALKKAGCEVEFARYPGGAHPFPTSGPPGHRADYYARTLAWFKDHLGEPT